MSAKYNSGGMEKSIYLLAMLGLFAACEQKTTTVNPPADKKESNTTIVNPPSEKKERNTTVVNPPGGSKINPPRFVERAFPMHGARGSETHTPNQIINLCVLFCF
jgi:hypothetical protein